jgi:hypothetical protein
VSAIVLLQTSTNSEDFAGMKFLSSVGTLLSAASDLRYLMYSRGRDCRRRKQ